MKKIIFLIFLFLFLEGEARALNIVYPKTNPAKINSASTFFIGSTNPGDKLKINDIEVNVAPNGAFAQVVQLNVGANVFKIVATHAKTNEIASVDNKCQKHLLPDVLDFTIIRAQPQAAPPKNQALTEYPAMIFYVKEDNTPLRMTPVDGGINRMAHLQKDTRVLINGEKGDFYRVFLNTTLSGWVAKSDVEQKEKPVELIKVKELKLKEDKDFCIWEFDLNGKIPFAQKEENGLTLQLFNVDGCENNTYTLNVPAQKLVGYDACFNGDDFILKVRKPLALKPETHLKDVVIAVDAGHGGKELGAIGCCGDKEKDINLAIAQNFKKELELRGAKVVMTREDDSDVSLKERVKTAKANEAVLLISIHANALPDCKDPLKNRGTSVYYYHNQAKPLAESILKEMTTQLGTQNDKVRQGSLALVRPTSSVSVLIEVAYMINPDDVILLTDKTFQQNCAKAIADGIEKYLEY